MARIATAPGSGAGKRNNHGGTGGLVMRAQATNQETQGQET
jgi:hypothetical protein